VEKSTPLISCYTEKKAYIVPPHALGFCVNKGNKYTYECTGYAENYTIGLIH